MRLLIWLWSIREIGQFAKMFNHPFKILTQLNLFFLDGLKMCLAPLLAIIYWFIFCMCRLMQATVEHTESTFLSITRQSTSLSATGSAALVRCHQNEYRSLMVSHHLSLDLTQTKVVLLPKCSQGAGHYRARNCEGGAPPGQHTYVNTSWAAFLNGKDV